MKKAVVLFLMCLSMTVAVAQKKEKESVKKVDTVKLALTPHDIETLSGLVKRANGIRTVIVPLQTQLNLVDSTFNFVLTTKLDANGYDPKKGRWGIVGNELLYLPNKNDSAGLKLQSAGSSALKPK